MTTHHNRRLMVTRRVSPYIERRSMRQSYERMKRKYGKRENTVWQLPMIYPQGTRVAPRGRMMHRFLLRLRTSRWVAHRLWTRRAEKSRNTAFLKRRWT